MMNCINNIIKLLILLFSFQSFSQKIETKLAGGINVKDENINSVFNLWKNYLSANPDKIYDNPFWNDLEKKKYKSYDLLKSEGFLNPSLYALEPNNMVLYIKEAGDDYLIHSMYYWINEDSTFNPLAITNVVAKKENGNFKLYNYLPLYTVGWKSKQIGIIDYHFHEDYVFDEDEALKANNLLKKLNELFDLNLINVTYYIARNCDEIHKMKGYDYIVSMGRTPNLCGFYDDLNNIVYSNAKVGEYHMHELIHVINNKYINANYLLLSGLSVYTNDKNCYLGKPFIYHVSKIQKYLDINPDTDLTNFEDLPQVFGTDSYYFVGALITDIILEKGGINLLKEGLQSGKEDKYLLDFIMNKMKINKNELNILIKNKLKSTNKSQKFTFLINY